MVTLRRIAVAILVAGTVALPAAAASINFSTATLGAGAAVPARCTSAGLSMLQNLSGTTVISVTITGLPAACGGATAQATVNNGTANSSGSATIAAGGGSVTVVLGAAVAVGTVEGTDIVVTGP